MSARWLEVLPPPPGPEAELPPEVSRALKKLRSCARARPRTTDVDPVPKELREGDFEPHLAAARRFGVRRAILKANSPSCGPHRIHDGTFSGRLVEGCGVTAALLRREGIEVCDEQRFSDHVLGHRPRT